MKKIIKNFNNFVKETIFKVQNKTNNNFKISGFNKYFIGFIALLFIYLFYLLIPLLYEKTWLKTNIKSKLFNEFKINLSTSAEISYRILPAPHFLIIDSKIHTVDNKKKSIAQIKNFKVFLHQGKFLNKDKMNITRLVIDGANFSLLRSDLNLLSDFKNKRFSNKKIKINNSNIFFKDNFGEIISIIKINESTAFFDNKKLLNFINLNGEVFNVPFNFNFQYQNDYIGYRKFDFSAKLLKLKISNESTLKKKLIYGQNNISFLNSTIHTKYNIKDKLIFFKSDNSRLNNSQINYDGVLSINPFDLNLNINLDNYKISKLFDINPILVEFINSGLLFNKNISLKSSIIINSNEKNEIFQNATINVNIINGKFNLNNSKFVNDSIGLLELSNSNLFFKNDNLILNTSVLLTVKNSDNLFSFLKTNKQARKEIKNILINLEYNFLKNDIKFNNVKINNSEVSSKFLNIIEGFSDNNLNNLNKSRQLLNELLNIYEG